MAVGRRCELGCESWPNKDLYKRCPECGQPTEVYRNLDPIDDEEAESRLLHAQFVLFYTKWCKMKGYSAEDDSTLPADPEIDAKYDMLYPEGKPDAPPSKEQDR
jgi:hypothetical protein